MFGSHANAGPIAMDAPITFPPETPVSIHLTGVDAEWYRAMRAPIEPGTPGKVVAVRGDRAERVVELATGERMVLSPDSLRAAR